jgi:predicted nucleic acid-binding protein
MIVLDTNVVSEAMKPEPDMAVRDWLDDQASETLYLSSVTVAELLFGIGVLPEGRRKAKLTEIVEGLTNLFAGRILPFDLEAARHHADLAVAARNAGKGFPTPDGYIAAIAASRGFAVATRDTSAFAAVGLKVIHPWKRR